MVTKKHIEVIEGRRLLIFMDFIDPYEAAEDGVAEYNGTSLDKWDKGY